MHTIDNLQKKEGRASSVRGLTLGIHSKKLVTVNMKVQNFVVCRLIYKHENLTVTRLFLNKYA